MREIFERVGVWNIKIGLGPKLLGFKLDPVGNLPFIAICTLHIYHDVDKLSRLTPVSRSMFLVSSCTSTFL